LPRLESAIRGRVIASLTALGTITAARWPKFDALVRRHQRVSLGVATGFVLLMLVTTVHSLSRSKTDASSASGTAAEHGPHARVVPAAPSPPVYKGPSVVGPAPVTDRVAPSAATARMTAPSADKAQPPPPPEDKVVYATPGVPAKGAPVPPKGFGFLTVHSSIGYAWVYVQLYRYGHVERRLTVRCGKRFLSLGNPRPNGGEPIWFAPSRTVDIPCGGAVEVTMMPRWIP